MPKALKTIKSTAQSIDSTATVRERKFSKRQRFGTGFAELNSPAGKGEDIMRSVLNLPEFTYVNTVADRQAELATCVANERPTSSS